MIQINELYHTTGGLEIAPGSVLDVRPNFVTPTKVYKKNEVEDGENTFTFEKIIYPISFDLKIFKSLEFYKEQGSQPLNTGRLQEFDVALLIDDVNIQDLTSVNSLLELLVNHIENGGDGYSGVGAGKTEIVYP